MKAVITLAIITLITSACANHSAMRGTVAMKINKEQAHVCLGSDAVITGDKILFFDNKCTSPSGKYGEAECTLNRLGEGTVSKILNEHYSLIKTDGSFDFKEGTLVEKARK